MPLGGRTASAASSGNGRLNGPNSVPKKPPVVKALSSSDSPLPSSRWPMLMNAGITGLTRPQHAGHPRADVRRGHGLRRHVAGVPVVLMPRVQDVAQVGQHVRADERAAVHHVGDVLQALADLDVVDDRVDGRERAQDPLDRQPDLERL